MLMFAALTRINPEHGKWNCHRFFQLGFCINHLSRPLATSEADDQMDTTTPLPLALEAALWGSWEEADLAPVVRYVRGSTRLSIPPEWRKFDDYAQTHFGV